MHNKMQLNRQKRSKEKKKLKNRLNLKVRAEKAKVIKKGQKVKLEIRKIAKKVKM